MGGLLMLWELGIVRGGNKPQACLGHFDVLEASQGRKFSGGGIVLYKLNDAHPHTVPDCAHGHADRSGRFALAVTGENHNSWYG